MTRRQTTQSQLTTRGGIRCRRRPVFSVYQLLRCHGDDLFGFWCATSPRFFLISAVLWHVAFSAVFRLSARLREHVIATCFFGLFRQLSQDSLQIRTENQANVFMSFLTHDRADRMSRPRLSSPLLPSVASQRYLPSSSSFLLFYLLFSIHS